MGPRNELVNPIPAVPEGSKKALQLALKYSYKLNTVLQIDKLKSPALERKPFQKLIYIYTLYKLWYYYVYKLNFYFLF